MRWSRSEPNGQLDRCRRCPWRDGSNLLIRILWLALVAGAAWCITSRSRRTVIVGAGLVLLALVWGLDEALSLAKTETWSAGQLVALCAALGLVIVAGLTAREVWPEHPRRWIGVAAFVAAYPVVLRMGVLFHPETLNAFFCALAVLVAIRAARRDWPFLSGVLAGGACGLALLTRQSAIVVLFCLVVAAVVYGRRRSVRFSIAVLGAAALVAGPWLGYAAATWGNPLQGNLQQPGSMLAHGEPLTFYASLPLPGPAYQSGRTSHGQRVSAPASC